MFHFEIERQEPNGGCVHRLDESDFLVKTLRRLADEIASDMGIVSGRLVTISEPDGSIGITVALRLVSDAQ